MTNKELTQYEFLQKTIFENTLYYLENYLNPNKNWDRNISPKDRIHQITKANVNWKTISEYIRSMEYRNFLKTFYWKAIAEHTKFRAGNRCQVCNSPNELVTHHRNYSIHGSEHAHMWELTVLCNECHNKFHDQDPKVLIKENQALIIIFVLFTALTSFYLFIDP